MQDPQENRDELAVGHITIRWSSERHAWLVAAWARRDGDSGWVEVHPMWDAPRYVADDEHAHGTLLRLLGAVQTTVHTLQAETDSGQMTLW